LMFRFLPRSTPRSLLFPYTTLFRSHLDVLVVDVDTLGAVHLLHLVHEERLHRLLAEDVEQLLRRDRSLRDLLSRLDRHLVSVTADRKSTRLNSSHLGTSYAVFCLKK